MFISESILKDDKLKAFRQDISGSLQIDAQFDTICLSIHGATAEEIDAIAAAINAPVERMKREREPIAQDVAEE